MSIEAVPKLCAKRARFWNSLDYLLQNNIQPQAYSSFCAGRHDSFENEALRKIGAKYGKSIAQITLRRLIQRGVIVIFDFEPSAGDMEKISTLD